MTLTEKHEKTIGKFNSKKKTHSKLLEKEFKDELSHIKPDDSGYFCLDKRVKPNV